LSALPSETGRSGAGAEQDEESDPAALDNTGTTSASPTSSTASSYGKSAKLFVRSGVLKMPRDTRSPLKSRPLRNPGQSVDEALGDSYDRLLMPLMLAAFLVAIAAMEWFRHAMAVPLSPWLYTFFAAAAVVYATYRITKVLPEARQLRLGRDGERVVGQYLERLREKGYRVFHDVVGAGFNIDHVIIGPAGIFSVETKTYSKPVRGEARIQFDGEKLNVNGYELDRDPIAQAKAQASWLREVISESTSQKMPIRPVIVFPGWFIEQSKGSTRDLWVLNPKALPDFLDHERPVLTREQVALASTHLSLFIRSGVRT
jgi:hypothetical protein